MRLCLFEFVQAIVEVCQSIVVLVLGHALHVGLLQLEQHQGQVGVESVFGKGATFWFTLPLPCAANAQER